MLKGFSVVKSHQEYASGDSPTLTTNSESSEITEAITDFNFLRIRSSQHFVEDPLQKGSSQIQPMQQPGYNDMQLLSQHMMFKQLQELQRQHQLLQFGDAKQQSSLNQLSSQVKQDVGGQFPPLSNRAAVNDPSPMFMKWVQRGSPSLAQGISNRPLFPQEQNQAVYSMDLVPQQLDVPSYGAPISNGRVTMDHYSEFQAIHNNSANFLTKTGSHPQRSTNSGNPFVVDQTTFSTDQVVFSQGDSMSEQGFHGKNVFEEVPNQCQNSYDTSWNIQQGNTLQTNELLLRFQGREGGTTSWPGTLQEKMAQLAPSQGKMAQLAPSQGSVLLDPVEEKILYNMDDKWDASFGRGTDMGVGGYGNPLEDLDNLPSFPAIQSGSWSALMQSAVAEASSTDTGMHEEWSGLTFQNNELSPDNQPSNIVDSNNQQQNWGENNLQSPSSFTSRPFSMFDDSSVNSTFPGFQQPSFQIQIEQREHLHLEDSNPTIQKSPMPTGEWVDSKSSQKPFENMDNNWSGQFYDQSESDAYTHQHSTISYDKFSQPHSETQDDVAEATLSARDSDELFWNTNGDSNQIDYIKQVGIPFTNKGSESTQKDYNRIQNDPAVFQNSYERAAEVLIDKQYQMNLDTYGSKSLSSQEQEHLEQSQFRGDISGSVVNLDKGHLNRFQVNMKASEETPSRRDLDASTNFHKPIGFNGPHATAQASQNIYELQKVNQSKGNSFIQHFSSTGPIPYAELSGNPKTSVAQQYNQSSFSEGFSLKFAPPTQLSYPNVSQGLTQPEKDLNLGQVSSGLGEENLASLVPPSVPLHASQELSQISHWDDRMSALRQMGIPSSLFMQGNSVAAITSSPQYVRNQLMFNAPGTRPTTHTSLPTTAGRFPPFSLLSCQDTSQQVGNDVIGQQYPSLEALSVYQPHAMSGVGQQGGLSVRKNNVWTNRSMQQQLSVDKANSMETTSSPSQALNDPNFQEVEYVSPQGHGIEEEEKERYDTSQTGGVGLSRKIPNANAFPSGSLLAHSDQEDLARMQPADNNEPTGPLNVDHSYSLLDQMEILKNVETDPRRVSDAQEAPAIPQKKSKSMKLESSGQNSTSQLNSLSLGSGRMLGFSTTGTRKDTGERAPFHPPQDASSGGMIAAGQNKPLSQYRNMVLSSWLNRYGTFRNEQMPQMYSAQVLEGIGGQFNIGKPFQSLHVPPFLHGVGSEDAIQSGGLWSSTASTLVASEPFSAPNMHSDITGEIIGILGSKKRKSATSEFLPWHKEVNHGSQREQNISMVDQGWALATSRLIDKVEDEVLTAEGAHLMIQSKRRLISTTRLMQQLLFPPPRSILSADASSQCDLVTYFVSRSSIGDTCSLIHCTRKNLNFSLKNSNLSLEKLQDVKNTDHEYFAKVVEDFVGRGKKLENEFLRLSKGMSVSDIGIEYKEVERVSVINRFAMFHIRQTDSSGSSSGSASVKPKTCSQRYVTIYPMPINVPEGVHCLSL